MIKRELAKDEKLKNESWDRFLPKFRKVNTKAKAKKSDQILATKKKDNKKEYTPFPPAQMPRKEDLAMESGEYFLKPEQKEAKAAEAKLLAREQKKLEKMEKRNAAFVAPDEESLRRDSDGFEQKLKDKKEKKAKDSEEATAKNDKKKVKKSKKSSKKSKK